MFDCSSVLFCHCESIETIFLSQQAAVELKAGAQVLREKQPRVTSKSQHVAETQVEIKALMQKGKPCSAVVLESMRSTTL